jgi:hypothetical protein
MLRLFDVTNVTAEQAKADAENLLSQVHQEVRIRRRVRGGTLRNSISGDVAPFTSLSAIRTGFPSSRPNSAHELTSAL